MDIFLVSSNSIVVSYDLLKRYSVAVLLATFTPRVVQKSLKTFSIYQCLKAACVRYLFKDSLLMSHKTTVSKIQV